MKKNTSTHISEIYEISDRDILEALQETGRLPKDGNFNVVFCVPGGGDYSNMELEITSEEPIIITRKIIVNQ